MLLFSVFSSFLLLSVHAADFSEVTTTFEGLRSSSTWPVQGSTFVDVRSAFGPRIHRTRQEYDFHRGIDINSSVGAPVYSAYAGVYDKYVVYSGGGKTVRIRHNFPNSKPTYAGKTLSRYYTLYMHLDSAVSFTRGDTIAAGTIVGYVGLTGSTSYPHLHFEIRVGTSCSLEYQLDCECGCSGNGYDPHVNPFLLFEPLQPTAAHNIAVFPVPTALTDGEVLVETLYEQPLVSRFVFTVGSGSSTVLQHILDFNEREGFNATTTAALDTPDITVPYIVPVANANDNIYRTRFIIPVSFVGAHYGTAYTSTVTVTDIWGKESAQSW